LAEVFTAYDGLVALSAEQNRTGQNLGDLTLNAGVYHYNSSALLHGLHTLEGHGQSYARRAYQIESTLTTGSASFSLIPSPLPPRSWPAPLLRWL
jgi:uncharacterized protein YigE (DUF2233 family)